MINEILKRKLLRLKESNDLRNEKFYELLKNLITISVGLLGLLFSLKSENKINYLTSIFFLITISLIALGILSGVILLYGEVHVLNKLRQSQQIEIDKFLDGTERRNFVKWIQRNKAFYFFELICYCSYILSIITLIIYCVLNEFN